MVHLPDDDEESEDRSKSETAGGDGDPSQTLPKDENGTSHLSRLQLKQIEMNTFSVAGICHATNVANMHRHLAKTLHHIPQSLSHLDPATTPSPQNLESSSLPPNPLLSSLVSLLVHTHTLYTPSHLLPPPIPPDCPSPSSPRQTCLLIPTQPLNFNIADERPIEEALWSHTPPIPTFRVVFPSEILERCRLGPRRELLFRPPRISSWDSDAKDEGGDAVEEYEVSLIYWRAGYEESEYTTPSPSPSPAAAEATPGIRARTLLSLSRAIHAPDLLTHLATFKSVQAAISSLPIDALAELLPDTPSRAANGEEDELGKEDQEEEGQETRAPRDNVNSSRNRNRAAIATKLKSTFLSFSDPSATLPQDIGNYVLKPNREGGGHAIFGADIPDHISRMDRDEKRKLKDRFILQRLALTPSLAQNTLLLPLLPSAPNDHRGIYEGDVVHEIGGVSAVLFRRNRDHRKRDTKQGRLQILSHEFLGYTFKTKPVGAREMSVVKGRGVFDWPLLIDDEISS
ncbi:MAG: hypothetical protein Q9160_006668 [Pyrenula sp. 1 TL-2023]